MGLTERELYPNSASGTLWTGLVPPPQPWLALVVKPRHEQAVLEALSMKGLEAYSPLYQAVHRWSDRLKKVDLPLFPGYVFCRGLAGSRAPLLKTSGVRSIVSFGGEIAPIPDLEIERVRRILASGQGAEPWPFLTIGQKVRIEVGALAGLEGILVEERDRWRVVVSVEMLQRSVAVHVLRGDITSAGPPSGPPSRI